MKYMDPGINVFLSGNKSHSILVTSTKNLIIGKLEQNLEQIMKITY